MDKGLTRAQLNKAVKIMKIELSDDELDNDIAELEVEKAAYKIMAYCNREDIPDALIYVLAEIAADVYKDTIGANSNQSLEDLDLSSVGKIKEGDNELTFRKPAKYEAMSSTMYYNASIDPFLAPYTSSLRRYRMVTVV